VSTASRSRGSASEPPALDPFQYGWRFIKVTRPDGEIEHELRTEQLHAEMERLRRGE
jgi:hypothetical protein